jgi:hypothetical protein
MARPETTGGDLLLGGLLFLVVAAAEWRLVLPGLFGDDQGRSRTGFAGHGHYRWVVISLLVFALVGISMTAAGVVRLLS